MRGAGRDGSFTLARGKTRVGGEVQFFTKVGFMPWGVVLVTPM